MSEIPKRVEKPWGYEIWWARTDRYVGKILHVKQGREPLAAVPQREGRDDPAAVGPAAVRDAARRARTGELRRIEMKPGDVFHITPGTLHRMTGLEDCDIVEVSTPGARRRGAPRRPLRPRGHVEALTSPKARRSARVLKASAVRHASARVLRSARHGASLSTA